MQVDVFILQSQLREKLQLKQDSVINYTVFYFKDNYFITINISIIVDAKPTTTRIFFRMDSTSLFVAFTREIFVCCS